MSTSRSIQQYNFKSSTLAGQKDYNIDEQIASELNTYLSFGAVDSFNDAYAPKYSTTGTKSEVEWTATNEKGESTTKKYTATKYEEVGDTKDGKIMTKSGIRSLFNKYSVVLVGDNLEKGTHIDPNKLASEWRLGNNVPLIDNRKNRTVISYHSKCTVKDLVQDSHNNLLGKAIYDYSDFMYCKHLGKISNNYLITLRRFPVPVDDYITTNGITSNTRRHSNIQSANTPSIGCMVTWLGTPGNDMNNILKYSVTMPFKFQKSQMHDLNSDADAGPQGPAVAAAAMFDATYRKQYMAGTASKAVDEYMGKMFGAGSAPYSAAQINSWRDENKVYGPVDAIRGTYMRSEDGIDFKQSFTLTFDYELRAYNGINGRQAMLDLLTNILNVVYTTGTFWGGGYRGGGAHQNNMFANLNIFKSHNNSFTDYMKSFSKDLSTITDSLSKSIQSYGGGITGLINFALNGLNQLGGMMIAGQLNRLGRPQRVAATSLLSAAPVGFWHVMVGNPHHPIMSMGNMILTNAEIEHYGPLGLDDFPTGLKVTVSLERGKPRDIRDIEKIYMKGNDRIFYSMGPKLEKLYEQADAYQLNELSTFKIVEHFETLNDATALAEANQDTTDGASEKGNEIAITNDSKQKLANWFGVHPAHVNALLIPSKEMEYGSQAKSNTSKK